MQGLLKGFGGNGGAQGGGAYPPGQGGVQGGGANPAGQDNVNIYINNKSGEGQHRSYDS